MNERRLAVVVGFLGKLPVAGMSYYNLHYIVGLQELGYDVHYVECINTPEECYLPTSDSSTSDPAYAVAYVSRTLSALGISSGAISFVDLERRCHGSGWDGLRAALRRADFVLTLADFTWLDEFTLCRRRIFIDGDPVFTQARLLDGDAEVATVLDGYDALCTIGNRIGEADCRVPAAGREWIPTRSVVATRLWSPSAIRPEAPITTIMNWSAWSEVVIDGIHFGHKDREFARLLDLPARTKEDLAVAVGGPAPRDLLTDKGWRLIDPLAVSGSLATYQQFIANSKADLGVAKHAYVHSLSGWFSDRSLCYLASGRPVLHQETGFSTWLPSTPGVLPFHDEESLVEAMDQLRRTLPTAGMAARRVAEQQFEAASVLNDLLSRAGIGQ